MKSDHFLKKAAFSHPNIVPAKKPGEESHDCKLPETKFKALNGLKKGKLHVVPVQKQKKTFFRYELKIIQEIKTSSAGNRTPVSNVTVWDTHHYTTEDTLPRISSKFMSFEVVKLQNDTKQLDQRSGMLLYTAT